MLLLIIQNSHETNRKDLSDLHFWAGDCTVPPRLEGNPIRTVDMLDWKHHDIH